MGKLADDEILSIPRMIQRIGEALVDNIGETPDMVLILRTSDGECRTFFGAGEATMADEAQHPRAVMTELLEQAAIQNKRINNLGGSQRKH